MGVPEDDICTQKRSLDLPGYFRAEKQWDLIVIKHYPTGRGNLLLSLN
ncbi:PaeR7I family type II restriction endonuclease [Methanoculleus sp. MH98A]